MLVLEGRNVNELWRRCMNTLPECVGQDSRNGRVWVWPTPVMSVYQRPTERVLFDPDRDANPFFHLMESLWMLAGRNHAGFLNHYVADFGARFADHDRIHGAYGHRWRQAFGFDQLDAVVEKLRVNPNDRQCVLQMWDCDEHSDLTGDWKDRPCNTNAYLRVRQDRDNVNGNWVDVRRLDLTVCCRSNDVVWGAYGANAVHFSMLQEYLAGRIGVKVGTLYQLSNNWHGYVDVVQKLASHRLSMDDLYARGAVGALPIGTDWERWDDDLYDFVDWHDALWAQAQTSDEIDAPTFSNTWFNVVAEPVAQTRWLWKQGRRREALARVDAIEATDWHQACRGWMVRRIK